MTNNTSLSEQKTPENQWVKESAFGTWFLGTNTWIKYVLRAAIEDLYRLLPDKHRAYPVIADIGCGHGHSINLLDEKFHPQKIWAIDIDPGVVSKATETTKDCNCTVEFKINNAAAIDLPDASVDLVLCHQTFHHLPDQEQAIREFYRILKPGGHLLFAESCRRFIHSWVIRLLFRHPMDVQKSAEEYIEIVKEAGFVVDTQNISKPYLWWSRWDFGILERVGIKPSHKREETMINLVARRPEE